MKILTLVLLAMVLAVATNSHAQKLLVISGQVLDENGQPLAGASVTALPDSLNGALPQTISDAAGRFAIEVYTTGRFKLAASKPDDGYAWMNSPFYYPTAEALPQVIVSAERPTPFVVIRLGPRAGKLSLRIADETARDPIRAVSINVCRVENPMYCHMEVRRARNGQYNLLVPAAPVFVEVAADGYKDWHGNEIKRTSFFVASNKSREIGVLLQRLTPNTPNSDVLEAPQPLSPESGTEFDHFPRLTKLEWSQVSGAVSYSVQIEFCNGLFAKECKDPGPWEGSSVPPTSGIQGTSFEFSFVGAQPGRWRVWAEDARGRAGAKSEWSVFFYRR